MEIGDQLRQYQDDGALADSATACCIFWLPPLRSIDDVGYAGDGVDRLVRQSASALQLDYVPPDEYEAAYDAHLQASQPATPQP